MYGTMTFAFYGVISKIKQAIETTKQFEYQIVQTTKVLNPCLSGVIKKSLMGARGGFWSTVWGFPLLSQQRRCQYSHSKARVFQR